MKFCIHCGAQLEDNDKFCTSCGQMPDSVEVNTNNTANIPEPEAFQTSNQSQYYEQTVTNTNTVSRGKAIAGLVLGICGLSFSWLGVYSFVGLIAVGLSIAGLIVSKPAKEAGSRMGRIGWRLALAGLIVSAILTVLFTIIWGAALS